MSDEIDGASLVVDVLGRWSPGDLAYIESLSLVGSTSSLEIVALFSVEGGMHGRTHTRLPAESFSTSKEAFNTYRGDPVTHHLDPSTGLNIEGASGNFVSGWRLGAEQLQSVLASGRLF